MDRTVARVLHVRPQQAVATTTRRPFDTPLLFVGVRCAVRYIVLPFVLPLLGVVTGPAFGIVTGVALGILLTLDVLAAIAIVATLRRLWSLRHPRRWQYLPVALVLAVLMGVFFIRDGRIL